VPMIGRTVDDVLAIAEHEWRLCELNVRDREALSADLRADLDAALADGASLDDMIGQDVRGFARHLATEAGARRVPYEYGRLFRVALAGLMPGLVLGFLFITGLAITPDTRAALATFYAVTAAVVLAGPIAAIRWRMRDALGVHRTVAALSLALPLAAIVATPLTFGFAWLSGYSMSPPALLLEVALILALFTAAVLAARRWALRDREPATAAEPAASTA
jgi:hypothetical protein